MPTIKTGKTRSLTLNVTRTGEDNSTSSLTLDGKIDLGIGFPAIDDAQLAALTDQQFNDRVEAWKSYIKTTYEATEPDLYNYIARAFSELNGVVVRLYKLTGNYAVATTYPVVLNGNLSLVFKDGDNNNRYLDITSGSYKSLKVAAAGASANSWSNFSLVSKTATGLNFEYYVQTGNEYNKMPNIYIQNTSANGFISILWECIDVGLLSAGDEIGICWSSSENPGIGDNYNSYVYSTESQYSMIGIPGSGTFYCRGYYIHSGTVEYSNQLVITT